MVKWVATRIIKEARPTNALMLSLHFMFTNVYNKHFLRVYLNEGYSHQANESEGVGLLQGSYDVGWNCKQSIIGTSDWSIDLVLLDVKSLSNLFFYLF